MRIQAIAMVLILNSFVCANAQEAARSTRTTTAPVCPWPKTKAWTGVVFIPHRSHVSAKAQRRFTALRAAQASQPTTSTTQPISLRLRSLEGRAKDKP